LNNTTGIQNTAVGVSAGPSTAGLTNTTCIGYNASASASNSLILGNGANVGIGTTNPTALLTCSAAYTNGGTHAEETNVRILLGVTGLGYGVGIQLRVPANATVNESDLQFTTTDNSSNQIVRMTIKGSSNPTGGNVGIGTASPAAQIHIRGAGQATQAAFSTTGNLGGSIILQDSVGSLYNGGAMVFGADQGYFATIKGLLTDGTVNTRGDISIATRNLAADSTLTNRLYIQSDGNVGIGTTSPLSRFTIRNGYSDGTAGGLCIDATDGAVYNMRLSSYVQAGGQVAYKFTVNNQASSVDSLILGYNGNVGIGTTSPFTPLHVSAASSAANSSGNMTTGFAVSEGGGGPALNMGVFNTGGVQYGWLQSAFINNAGVTRPISLNPVGGNVGIGTTNPSSYNLQVSGSIGATGDITAFFSDERLKTKTGPITEALDKVCTLDTFTYTHNDLARSFGFMDKRQYVGISAQQVQKVQPEVVRIAPFDADGEGSKSGEDYITVQYERLIPLLIEAIKEERAERLKVDERLARLEKLLEQR